MRTILCLLLLALNTIALATNYYVSNTGNDSYDGKSPSTAWRTMANVDNNTSFKPGDSILFERGGVWYENFRIAVSGSPSAQITYGAYGTGDRPIISGMREIPEWDDSGNWTEGESNQWSMSWSSTRDRLRIWIDDDEKQRSGSLAVSESNPWQWHDNNFYVYSVGNPATTFTSIKTTNYEHFLGRHRTANVHYITIEDIEVNGWYSSRLYGPVGWIIQRCVWGKYFALDGIRIIRDEDNGINPTGGKIRHNTLDSYCRLPQSFVDLEEHLGGSDRAYTTEDGLVLQAGTDWEIHDNYFGYWAHTNLSIRGLGDEMVEGIKIYRNYFTTIGTNNGRAIGGFAYIGSVNPNNPVELYNNIIDQSSNSSTFDIPYGKVYNNIFYGVRGREDDPSISAHGLRLTGRIGNPEYMQIFNNIFANNKGHGLEFRHSTSYNNIANNIIANNIFYNNEGYNFTWSNGVASNVQFNADRGSVNIHNNEFYNNLFYSSKTNMPIRVYGTAMTVEAFNALDGSGNQRYITEGNVTGDPLFIDPYGDFRITLGSPALGQGIAPLSEYDHGGTKWKNPPSIGSFEWNDSLEDKKYPEQFTLNIEIEGNGLVVANEEKDAKSITVESNKTISIEATPDSGWIFSNWAGDATGHTNPLEVTMDTNKNIIAVFTEDAYNLTITSEGEGSVAINPDQISYSLGTPIYLEATAELGWKFSNWAGDAAGHSNPLKITMDANKNIIAVFTEDAYNITITSEGEGSVSINPDQISYSLGTPIYLEATAKEGWHFDEWNGDLYSNYSSESFMIEKNMKITAIFSTIPKSGNPITNASDSEIFPNAEKNIRIYPNPAKDYFKVAVKESLMEPEYFQIINMNGKIVYEDLLNAEITDVQIPSNINTGIYIIKIILGGLPYYAHRLVITR